MKYNFLIYLLIIFIINLNSEGLYNLILIITNIKIHAFNQIFIYLPLNFIIPLFHFFIHYLIY